MRLLTPKETAAFLRCSVKTLERWRNADSKEENAGPPYILLGSKIVRYELEDLRTWIENKKEHNGQN